MAAAVAAVSASTVLPLPLAAEDDESLLYFPPPLVVEPRLPPVPPEDEEERDPGGILILPNSRANDTPGGCFDQQTQNPCAQNETALAVNPTQQDNWVGGANDYSGPILLDGRAQSSCGFYASNDAGQTWSAGLLPTQPGFTGGGDPSLAFDSSGDLYYICLNFELTLPGFNVGESGLFVFKSTTNGASFGAPTEVVTGSGAGDFHDKPFLDVAALSDKVYVAWIHQSDVRFAGSDDGGATFSAPDAAANVEVNDPANGSNQGPVITTVGFPNPEGPDSETIYVAWLAEPGAGTSRILFDRSFDGGMTFGDDVTVENNVVQFPFRQTGAGTGLSNRPTLLGEFGDPVDNPESAFRVNSFPSMDACKNPLHPNFGHLYLVFADNRFGDGDIFFKRSEDGGESWPGGFTRRVNDDSLGNGKDQFFPWVDVDENCKLNISFYDRRDDPANRRFHLYFADSTDGGDTFLTNARVSTVASTNLQFLGGFIGDYLQNAATAALDADFHHDIPRALSLWMDTREGAQDVFAGLALQTQRGSWINVDVDLVADQEATDLDFVFPGDVTGDFGGFYEGPLNPFDDRDITFDAGDDETTLSFVDPQPGPVQPGDLVHVGFRLQAEVSVIDAFWTGSGDIGSIPMPTVDFTYDPDNRVFTTLLCNERADGQALALLQPGYATVELPLQLEELTTDDLPGALAAQGEALAPLPDAAGPLASGACYTAEIPETVFQFEAVVVTATFLFDGSSGRSRLQFFAQKIAKDAREVEGEPRERFLYTAKLVCGVQPDTTDLRLARGHYATTINVFNPGPQPAQLRKQLALAIPPGRQVPGELRSLGRDSLPPQRALATECDDIRRRVFRGTLPASVIDGVVSIVSDRPLEVVGVYTTATLNAEGTAEDHSSIHLERATELELANGVEPLQADLTIDEGLQIDAVCRPVTCDVDLRFTVLNIGAADAGPFEVTLRLTETGSVLDVVPVAAGLPAGDATVLTTDFTAPATAPDRRICIQADEPADVVEESDETNNQRCVTY